jgi:hypothetical protein
VAWKNGVNGNFAEILGGLLPRNQSVSKYLAGSTVLDRSLLRSLVSLGVARYYKQATPSGGFSGQALRSELSSAWKNGVNGNFGEILGALLAWT